LSEEVYKELRKRFGLNEEENLEAFRSSQNYGFEDVSVCSQIGVAGLSTRFLTLNDEQRKKQLVNKFFA
jgi:hypothetical protein